MVSITFHHREPIINLVWMGKGVSINRRRKLLKRGHKFVIGNDPIYAAFIEDMAWTFLKQRKGVSFVNPVFVFIIITKGVRRGHTVDLDAYTKQIIDALEHGGVIRNDNQVSNILIQAAGTNKDEDIIMVQVMETEAFHWEIEPPDSDGNIAITPA